MHSQLQILTETSKFSKRSNLVIRSWFGWRVSLYLVKLQNAIQYSWKGNFILFDKIPLSTIELLHWWFQVLLEVSLIEKLIGRSMKVIINETIFFINHRYNSTCFDISEILFDTDFFTNVNLHFTIQKEACSETNSSSLKLVRTPLNYREMILLSMRLYTSDERHHWFPLYGTSRTARCASKATKYKMKNDCPPWDSNPQLRDM